MPSVVDESASCVAEVKFISVDTKPLTVVVESVTIDKMGSMNVERIAMIFETKDNHGIS